MDNNQIIIVSVFSAAWLVLLVLVVVLFTQVSSLRRRLSDMHATGPIRVQTLKLDDNDKNHAFYNPTISPDEELSRRGYSMYVADDVESGRGTTERQAVGHFVEELERELDHRHHREQRQQQQHQPQHQQQNQQQHQQSRQQQHQQPQQHYPPQQHPPPFLREVIEANRNKMANPGNAKANQNTGTRQSNNNSNFSY